MKTIESIREELNMVEQELEDTLTELSNIDTSLTPASMEAMVDSLRGKINVLSLKRLTLSELSRTKVSKAYLEQDIEKLTEEEEK